MSWQAEKYDHNFSFVTTYGTALLDILDPQRGERVLDLGCGTGHLTAQAAARGALAEGLDADPAMIARARAEYPGLTFLLSDARTFTVEQPVDAVLSNATLHWIPATDQDSVLDRVHAALRPGGRFVAEMGGAGNVALVLAAVQAARRRFGLEPAPDPWHFPTTAEQAGRLERAGFRVRRVEHYDRPTALAAGDTVADWLDMFGPALLADVPDSERPAVVNAVVELAAPALRDATGKWEIDYVRLRWYATAQ